MVDKIAKFLCSHETKKQPHDILNNEDFKLDSNFNELAQNDSLSIFPHLMINVSLNSIIEIIIDMMNKTKDDDRDGCVLLHGKLNEKHLEIKIIKLTYDNKPSILIFITDMTYHIVKTKIEDNKEYKSLLLSSLSHEIKTPLNGSLGMIQTSLDDENTPIEIKKNLLLPALKSLKVLLCIINDVLDYSQILTNKLRLDFKSLDIKMLLYEVIDLMELHIQKKENVKFTVDIDDSIPYYFNTDPSRLTQILLCLLNNAYKFTFKGEIKIKMRYQVETKYIIISIKDTGVGMTINSLLKLKKLFELSGPDYVHKKLSNNSTGCALGLSIASILAKYLGPSNQETSGLDVHSMEGEGSKFTLTLENKKEGSCNFMIKKDGIEFYEPNVRMMIRKIAEGKCISNVQHFQTRFSIEKKTIPPEYIKHFENIKNIGQKNQIQNIKMNYKDKTEINIGDNNQENIFNISINDSVSGKGVTFKEKYCQDISNSFKVFKILKQEQLNPPKNNKIPKNNIVILIVDDDSFNIYSLEIMFKLMNVKYESAYNGKVAIDKVIQNPKISFIFMDCNMPLMDGWEATKILREKMKKGDIQNIPIVAVTAYCDEENKMKCYKAGMDEILSKPVTKKDIIQIFKKYSIL